MNTIATNSLERGLAVMMAIGRRRGGMTNAELSRHLDVPKSTCSYILSRLEAENFVIRDKVSGRYTIGLNTLALAHDALREIRFPEIAEPTLYRLAERTGLVAVIGAMEGNRILTVDRVESPDFMRDSAEKGRSRWRFYPPRHRRGVGAEYPLHASALGRVVLAYQKPEALAGVLENIRFTKFTPKTIVSKTELLSELERIREDGYAITDQQWTIDTLAIAAPIIEANGDVRASVCITGSRLSPAFRGLRSLIVAVKEAGREISKSLTRVPVHEGHTLPPSLNSPYEEMRDIKATGMFPGRPIASVTH